MNSRWTRDHRILQDPGRGSALCANLHFTWGGGGPPTSLSQRGLRNPPETFTLGNSLRPTIPTPREGRQESDSFRPRIPHGSRRIPSNTAVRRATHFQKPVA